MSAAAAIVPMATRQVQTERWNRAPCNPYFSGMKHADIGFFTLINNWLFEHGNRATSARRFAQEFNCSEDTASRRFDRLWRMGKLAKFAKPGEANLYRRPFYYAGLQEVPPPLPSGYVEVDSAQLPLRPAGNCHRPRRKPPAAADPPATTALVQMPEHPSARPMAVAVRRENSLPPPAARAADPQPAPTKPERPQRFETPMAEICWEFQTSFGDLPGMSALDQVQRQLGRMGLSEGQFLRVLREGKQFRSWWSTGCRIVRNPDGLLVSLAKNAGRIMRALPAAAPSPPIADPSPPAELTLAMVKDHVTALPQGRARSTKASCERCRGTGRLSSGDHCNCPKGLDLYSMEPGTSFHERFGNTYPKRE